MFNAIHLHLLIIFFSDIYINSFLRKKSPCTCSSIFKNQLLSRSGFDKDIVTLYDFQISLEFSMNQLSQKGLFLHR